MQQELTKQKKAEAAYDAMREKPPKAKLAHRLQKLKEKVAQLEVGGAPTGVWNRALNTVGWGAMPVDKSTLNDITALTTSIDEAQQAGMAGFDTDAAAIKQSKRLSPEAKQQALQRHPEAFPDGLPIFPRQAGFVI